MADRSRRISRRDILLGTIYLLIIAAAALTAFIFALIGAGILFQLLAFAVFAIAGCVYLSYRKRKKLRKHGCRPFAAHQRRTLRRSQGMEKKTAKLEFSIAEPSGMPNRKKVHRWFPAFWEIVGMSGNTLIIKLKQGK